MIEVSSQDRKSAFPSSLLWLNGPRAKLDSPDVKRDGPDLKFVQPETPVSGTNTLSCRLDVPFDGSHFPFDATPLRISPTYLTFGYTPLKFKGTATTFDGENLASRG